MNSLLKPTSVDELATLIRSSSRVLAVGGRTKPRLSAVEATLISTKGLRGLLEYDPGEFTFTALAGTPMSEVVAILETQGQYLPFDPVLLEAGSTLGGTVATGMSGSGRHRFGGIRDFILGIRMIDGSGRVLRLGGKVVKNAAGFDLPKFMVGSLGRFGILTEMTFKVFPRPESRRTLCLRSRSLADSIRIFDRLGRSRFDPEAVDLAPGIDGVLVRLAGPEAAMDGLVREVLTANPGEPVPPAAADILWRDLREVRWTHPTGVLLRIPCHRAVLEPLDQVLKSVGARVHFSAAGNQVLASLPEAAAMKAVSAALVRYGLSAITLSGGTPLFRGILPDQKIESGVKQALDPEGRFPGLDF